MLKKYGVQAKELRIVGGGSKNQCGPCPHSCKLMLPLTRLPPVP